MSKETKIDRLQPLYVVQVCGVPNNVESSELDVGEIEGVFNHERELLSYWSSNDADFREEYYSELFEKLGYSLDCVPGPVYEELQNRLWKQAIEDQGLV